MLISQNRELKSCLLGGNNMENKFVSKDEVLEIIRRTYGDLCYGMG